MKTTTRIALSLTVCFAAANFASAAVISTVFTYGSNNGAFNTMNGFASSTDLLETNLASASSNGFNGTNDATAVETKLTNGSSGIAAFSYTEAAIDTDGSGYTVEFVLDTSVNTLGYDLTSISSFSGLSIDSVTFAPDFEIQISTVGSAGFTSLGSFSSTVTSAGRIVITDDQAVPLATGVDVIRFINATGTRGSYRELDVEGTATVPEPASMALLGMGGLMMLRRRA